MHQDAESMIEQGEGEGPGAAPGLATSEGFRIRALVYAAYEFALFVGVGSVWVRYEGIPFKWRFKDMRPVQHFQETHLALAVLLFLAAIVFLAYRKDREFIPFLSVIVFALLWGTNREMDGVWEWFELDLIYDSLKFVTAVPGILILLAYRRECWEGWVRLRKSRPILLLSIAVGGYLFAQIVGKGFSVLDLDRNYKRATEESLELLFGAFFLFAAVEMVRSVVRRR